MKRKIDFISAARLQISAGVPIGVVDDDTIGTGEIETYTARFGGKHECEDARVGIELRKALMCLK